MANPQPNPFCKVSTELLEAYLKIRVPGAANQIWWAIVRKTYGYGKKMDRISKRQFTKMTGIDPRHVRRALNVLLSMNLITEKGCTNIGTPDIATYGIQKDYDKWCTVPKKVRVPKKAHPRANIGTPPVTKNGTPPCANNGTTIDNNTIDKYIDKDTIDIKSKKKKRKIPDTDHAQIIEYFNQKHMDKFGFKYPFEKGKDGNLIKGLLKDFPLAKLQLIVDDFFDDPDDFVINSGFKICILKTQVIKIAQKLSGNMPTIQPIGRASPEWKDRG